MKISPLHDNLLVSVIARDSRTTSGLHIPETVSETATTRARVLEVGPGKRTDAGERVPLDAKKGDIVVLRDYSGFNIEVGGEKYRIVSEADVLATLDEVVS